MPVKTGKHILYVPGGLRAAAGVRVGDAVTVDIRPLGPQLVSPPGDLAVALEKVPGATGAWDRLAVSHRRELTRFDEPFRDKRAQIRQLFDLVRQTVESIGPVTLVAYRDRFAFMVRVRFAGARPGNRWVDVDFRLTRRVESPRSQKVETLSPYTHIHTVRVMDPSDVDVELTGWLREAYAVGCQDHLQTTQQATP